MVGLLESKQDESSLLDPEIRELLPRRDELLSSDKVLDECAKFGVPVSVRTLQLWVRENLISPPMKMGREAFYPKEVLEQIAFLYLTRAKLGCRKAEARKLMTRCPSAEKRKEVLLELEEILKDLAERMRKQEEMWTKRVRLQALRNLLLKNLDLPKPKKIGIADIAQEVVRLQNRKKAQV